MNTLLILPQGKETSKRRDDRNRKEDDFCEAMQKAKDVALTCKHIFLGRMSPEEQDRMSARLPSHCTRILQKLQEVFGAKKGDEHQFVPSFI